MAKGIQITCGFYLLNSYQQRDFCLLIVSIRTLCLHTGLHLLPQVAAEHTFPSLEPSPHDSESSKDVGRETLGHLSSSLFKWCPRPAKMPSSFMRTSGAFSIKVFSTWFLSNNLSLLCCWNEWSETKFDLVIPCLKSFRAPIVGRIKWEILAW